MKLAGDYAIHLHRNGVLHSFLPGDELPDWAAAKIDNPYTRGEIDSDADEPVDPEVIDEMPPKSGPAASRQAWEDYAVTQGIEVDPDWKRDDIIAAVEAAR